MPLPVHRIYFKLLLLFWCLTLLFNNLSGSTAIITAQGTVIPNDTRSLGFGLNGIADWSPQLPFINHFKMARSWMTHTAGDSSWDSQAYDLFALDENSYPTKISSELDYVHTLLLRDVGGDFKTGKYIVAYRGEGTLGYGFNAGLIEAESGAACPYLTQVEACDVIQVVDGEGGIHFRIHTTNPTNHIRDIAVVHEDQWDLYMAGEIFNPDWLARIENFRAVRFMDWMATNGSDQMFWADRPKPDYANYAGQRQSQNTILHKGVPVEVMVALGNKLHADVWFNMPHLATDNYMTQFAQYVKANLNPDLKAYVEFSNEVWNWQFQQAQDANIFGRQRWGNEGTAYLNWYGMRNAQMCDIWKDETTGVFFGDDSDRVICVMSGQTANTYTFNQITTCPLWVAEGYDPCHSHNVDALAITAYFSGGLGSQSNQPEVLAWIDDPQIDEYDMAFQQLADGTPLNTGIGVIDTLTDIFNTYTTMATDLGLQVVVYEGGQHITANGNSGQEIQRLTDFLIGINRDNRMGDLYQQMLTAWYDEAGTRTQFMHFVDVGGYTKYGSWGSLENLSQTTNPKYQALVNWNAVNPCWWAGCERNFFGPVSGGTTITLYSDRIANLIKTYEREITIQNPTVTTIAPYVALVRLDTETLIANQTMRPDCGDIRFYDNSGQSLPYWLESGCGEADTLLWVKLQQLPVEGATIVLTYKGPDSEFESLSDLTAIFSWLGHNNNPQNTIWLGANRGISGQEFDWQSITRLGWADLNRTDKAIVAENNVATLQANALNGLPAIQATDDLVAHGRLGGDYLSATANTFYFVLRSPAAADSYVYWFANNDIFIENQQLTYSLNQTGQDFIAQSASVVDNQFFMLNATMDVDEMNIAKNGLVLTQTSPITFTVPLTDNNTQMHFGDTSDLLLAETLIFSTALSAEGRQEVETYLNTKYHLFNETTLPQVSVGPETVQPIDLADWAVIFGQTVGTIEAINNFGAAVQVTSPIGDKLGYNRLYIHHKPSGDQVKLAQGFIYEGEINQQPPLVNLTAPQAGQVFIPGQMLTLSATASDPDGQIETLQFYNNSQILSDTFAVDNLLGSHIAPIGTYHLVAKATDNAQNIAFSPPVPIYVAVPVTATTTTITIDGQNNEWQSVPTQTISYPAAPPDDNADLSGFYQVQMDNDKFYLLFTVQDDIILTPDSGSNADDDSLEFFLDGDNSKGQAYDGVNDCQYRVIITTRVVSTTQSYCPTSDIQVATTTTAGGYILELAYPWRNLGLSVGGTASGLPLLNGTAIGFDAQLNDDDDGGTRDSLLSWHDIANKNWQTPANFATWRLSVLEAVESGYQLYLPLIKK